jgi:mono/diheme cytochrome c family protein
MNRMKLGMGVALVMLAGVARAEGATDVTFHKDILPIFQQSCQVCHRPGGANLGGMVAPMSFTTYEESRAPGPSPSPSRWPPAPCPLGMPPPPSTVSSRTSAR